MDIVMRTRSRRTLSGTIRTAVAGLDPSLAIVKLWYLPARAATSSR